MNARTAKKALKKYFGYDSFRPMQQEIIEAVYDQQDSVVLMPTGGGKSICYQIPAVTMPGTCVVVSPLISLMKDQVEGLKSNGVAAEYLNSSLSMPDQRVVEEQLFRGELDLLYVSPEKLVSQGFLPFLKKRKINLFAIDEAHCISAWGHDFRPEYTKLKFLKKEFPDVPIVALTATADKTTRQDIQVQLGLKEPDMFVASFDRPNISLEVRPGRQRIEQIIDFVYRHPEQPGIIYCLSRKSTEKVAEKLELKGINATPYHAGLSDDVRAKAQEDFINDKVQVIVATIAFGMGIDKSNVRWIIHYNLPKNLENYYQEIGRAGRDGVAAETVLFYSYGDVSIYKDILSQNATDPQHLELQMLKLDRMLQFAEASFCRRQILLNYFGENFKENCGNCDVCKNPPKYFDGTIIAQKALSAVYRLKGQVSMSVLIDVLRGSQKKSIYERGYQNIKTFGAGREHSNFEWQFFLTQLINTGYLDIDYVDRMNLKLTEASMPVLFENENVPLVKFVPKKEKEKKEKYQPIERSPEEQLFETLRQLRRSISQERGIPPYLVFSDATLHEMVRLQPMTDGSMLEVSGVSQRKLHLFGNQFIEAILEFKNKHFRKMRGTSYGISLELLQQGLSLEQIAEKRSLALGTIYSHMASLYEEGEDVPILRFINEHEIQSVAKVISNMEEVDKLKPIYEALNGEIEYNKIRLILSYLKKKGEMAGTK
jgi:ATP-dependent DNA helicase RecQ